MMHTTLVYTYCMPQRQGVNPGTLCVCVWGGGGKRVFFLKTRETFCGGWGGGGEDGNGKCTLYSGISLQWTPLGPSWLFCIERCPQFRSRFVHSSMWLGRLTVSSVERCPIFRFPCRQGTWRPSPSDNFSAPLYKHIYSSVFTDRQELSMPLVGIMCHMHALLPIVVMVVPVKNTHCA